MHAEGVITTKISSVSIAPILFFLSSLPRAVKCFPSTWILPGPDLLFWSTFINVPSMLCCFEAVRRSSAGPPFFGIYSGCVFRIASQPCVSRARIQLSQKTYRETSCCPPLQKKHQVPKMAPHFEEFRSQGEVVSGTLEGPPQKNLGSSARLL